MKNQLSLLFFLLLVGCGGNKNPSPGIPGTPEGPRNSRPQTNVGVDALGFGAAAYNAGNLVEGTKATGLSVPFGSLLDAFVDARTPLSSRFSKWAALLDPSISYLHRFHGLDATCVRNRTCWAGSQLVGYDLPRVEREAMNPASPLSAKACELANEVKRNCAVVPSIECLYSPLLEDNLSRAAKLKLLQTVAACAPGLTLVDDNVTGYAKLPGYLKECHVGDRPLPGDCDIVSFDGKSMTEADFEAAKRKFAGIKALLGWGPPENGRTIDEQTTPPPPPLRKHFPTRDYHLWETRVILPAAPIPASRPGWCQAPLMMDSRHLYKNFAEDKGTGDGRANRPLLIVPFKQSRIDIFDAKGNLVGFFGYYGTYQGGGFRYYMAKPLGSGHSSFELGKAAEASGGAEWVFFKEGAGCRAFNAYRRAGSFKSVFRGEKSARRYKRQDSAKKKGL